MRYMLLCVMALTLGACGSQIDRTQKVAIECRLVLLDRAEYEDFDFGVFAETNSHYRAKVTSGPPKANSQWGSSHEDAQGSAIPEGFIPLDNWNLSLLMRSLPNRRGVITFMPPQREAFVGESKELILNRTQTGYVSNFSQLMGERMKDEGVLGRRAHEPSEDLTLMLKVGRQQEQLLVTFEGLTHSVRNDYKVAYRLVDVPKLPRTITVPNRQTILAFARLAYPDPKDDIFVLILTRVALVETESER